MVVSASTKGLMKLNVMLFLQVWPVSPKGSPRILEWVGGLSLHQQISPTQGLNPGLLHCRRILYQLSYQESPSRMSMRYQSEPASAHLLCKKANLLAPVCGERKYRVYFMLKRPELLDGFRETFFFNFLVYTGG